jgi:hypothetical protein
MEMVCVEKDIEERRLKIFGKKRYASEIQRHDNLFSERKR